MSVIVWGFLLRLGQSAIESALTLVIGVVVAGVLRRMVGPAGTRRLFGSGPKGLVRGWLAGMLLPVCSLGVIPVAREMRRAGVPGGTVLAFVLAAPLLNPISFLYGLSLAEPVVILSFAAASLVLSTLAGFLWDWVFAGPGAAAGAENLGTQADAEPAPTQGPRRILAVFVTAARELAGRDLLFYAVGLAGSAALAAAIPFGALQHTMQHHNPASPALMTVVAVPLYTGPLTGMMKIGLMFEHGNSVGAAFVLFVLGIGTSLGTLVWLGTDFGWRRVTRWFLTYVGVVLGMAYAAEPLLYDTRKEEVDHTHAFDDYSSPFLAGASSAQVIPGVTQKLAEKFGPLERQAVYGLLGYLAAGLVFRWADRSGRVERWLTSGTAPDPAAGPAAGGPWWNRSVPGPVLGAVTLAGLVALSVIGAFIYYPDRDRCQDDMASVRADAFAAVNGGRADETIRHLERWDLIVRKLEVGEYLRSFGVTPEQAKTASDLREALEEMRDKLLAGDQAGARRTFLTDIDPPYRACKAAYPRTATAGEDL
ncbi:MAG: permease [Fimbriiglobus sp.]